LEFFSRSVLKNPGGHAILYFSWNSRCESKYYCMSVHLLSECRRGGGYDKGPWFTIAFTILFYCSQISCLYIITPLPVILFCFLRLSSFIVNKVLSIYLSIFLSIYLSIYLSINLSIYLSIYLSYMHYIFQRYDNRMSVCCPMSYLKKEEQEVKVGIYFQCWAENKLHRSILMFHWRPKLAKLVRKEAIYNLDFVYFSVECRFWRPIEWSGVIILDEGCDYIGWGGVIVLDEVVVIVRRCDYIGWCGVIVLDEVVWLYWMRGCDCIGWEGVIVLDEVVWLY